MNFKDMLEKISQLSEATKTTDKGRVHTAEPGGYGRKFDTDEEGDEKKKDAPAVKRGRGRPKKGSDDSGEVKKYDFSAFGVKHGKDVKLSKHDKSKTTKHSLKEYFEELDAQLIAEMVPTGMKPLAILDPKNKQAGAGVVTSKNPAVQKMLGNLDPKDVQIVMTQATPSPNTGMNPAIKPGQQLESMDEGVHTRLNTYRINGQDLIDQLSIQDGAEVEMVGDDVAILVVDTITFPELASMASKLAQQGKIKAIAGHATRDITGKAVPAGRKYINAPSPRDPVAEGDTDYSAKKARAGKDIGKPGKQFAKIAKSAGEKYGSKERGEKVAGAVLAKLRAKTNEADQPPHDSLASPLTLESKGSKPDFIDLDKDGNKKESMKKAAQDKKKVKEGMDHRLKSARHAGKAHALAKEAYNCRYDDMEEAKHYHEGYKEGLDECYGQMPIQGYVGETTPPATVPGMASQAMKQPAMEDDLDEMDKGDWMKHKAKTTPGDTFKAFGQTFKDKEVTESPFAFEAWDKELNALLESKEDVSEGMSVSISKGQQGSPDSVTVSAQDQEAEALLGLIKQAGLGLFGGDEPNGYGAPQGDTPQHGGVDVVGDHDGMMALIKKVTGGEQGNADYADEEGREETCEVCGESSCGCDEGQEMVDEVESEDQMTYQVAEDNPPDSGAHDTEIEVQDTAQMNQSGAAYNPKNDVDEGAGGPEASEEPVQPMVSEESDEEEDDHAEKAGKEVAKDIEHDEGHKGKDDDKAEEAGEKVTKDIEYDDKEDKKKGDKLDEWANDAGKKGTDTTFETDIEFMMNVISGGLNKRKQTGQTTIPVISSQLNRQVAHTTTDINESTDPVSEWKKLAGI
jgi:hypothetical protein